MDKFITTKCRKVDQISIFVSELDGLKLLAVLKCKVLMTGACKIALMLCPSISWFQILDRRVSNWMTKLVGYFKDFWPNQYRDKQSLIGRCYDIIMFTDYLSNELLELMNFFDGEWTLNKFEFCIKNLIVQVILNHCKSPTLVDSRLIFFSSNFSSFL